VSFDFEGLKELSSAVGEMAGEAVFVIQCLGQEFKGLNHSLAISHQRCVYRGPEGLAEPKGRQLDCQSFARNGRLRALAVAL
jgi:hypothetical protein